VHDEVQLSVVPSEVDHVKQLLEAAAPKAGDYYKFRVPITAAADSGDNWAATH
jgi:DNA polymerase I-like protein with 3'-5' exonuclease and polymerase domains